MRPIDAVSDYALDEHQRFNVAFNGVQDLLYVLNRFAEGVEARPPTPDTYDEIAVNRLAGEFEALAKRLRNTVEN